MVLQNKYKARASRRYNSARGGTNDGRGRGRGSGRNGMQKRLDPTAFPSLPGRKSDDNEAEEQGEEDVESDSSEQIRQREKYAPRKLTSNSWRYEEPTEGDAGEGEEEEEPEVDLSGLMGRLANLDSSKTSKALSSEQAAKNALDADAADVDASLLYLLDRQKERDRNAEQDSNDVSHSLPRHNLSEEQRKELEREGRRLQEEKLRHEKHQRRAQILQQAGAKTFSLDIGDHRRAKNEKVSRAAPKDSQSKTASHLYEDEDEEEANWNKKAGDDDVDAFLSEISSKMSNKLDGEQNTKLSERNKRSSSQHQGRTDEDFLDSIL